MDFYGQHGEDAIAWGAFQHDPPGVFLDIGAMDGMRFSNTYAFEQAGWTGLCVEAHPYYAKIAQVNRPHAIVVNAAISDKNSEAVPFYANRYGSLSTLDNSLQDYFKSYGFVFNGFDKISVIERTADSLLAGNAIDHVDLVSIDIEGTELRALKGFSLRKYQPRVLVIEAFNKPRKKLLEDYLAPFGYRMVREVANNYFFTYRNEDMNAIQHASVPKNLVHTLHPMSDELMQKAAKEKR